MRRICGAGADPGSFKKRKDIVVEHLNTQYADLMRHHHDDEDLQILPEADGRALEFTKKVAHLVTEQSYARRMGNMRANALNSTERARFVNQIKQAEKVKALIETNASDSDTETTLAQMDTDEQ